MLLLVLLVKFYNRVLCGGLYYLSSTLSPLSPARNDSNAGGRKISLNFKSINGYMDLKPC